MGTTKDTKPTKAEGYFASFVIFVVPIPDRLEFAR